MPKAKAKSNSLTIEGVRMSASISLAQVMEAIQQDDNLGFCIKCGAEAHGVEPDARKYECESCGAHAVFGAEELLLYMA